MAKESKKDLASNDCFIIMPIADPEGYDKGHFKKVYEDILKVACTKAGFNPVRADEVKQTNLIHLDILQKLIDSPMAICDLSNRNPNVLFELGLRQAFDKPTVLVQEVGTSKIFDISPLRYSEYRKELRYREVLEDQDFIAEALRATKIATDSGEGVNSIVGLLSLASPASLKEVSDNDATRMLQIVMSEMNDLRADFRNTMRKVDEKDIVSQNAVRIADIDFLRARDSFSTFKAAITNGSSVEDVKIMYDRMQGRISKISVVDQSPRRRIVIQEMALEADRIFADYVSKHRDK